MVCIHLERMFVCVSVWGEIFNEQQCTTATKLTCIAEPNKNVPRNEQIYGQLII